MSILHGGLISFTKNQIDVIKKILTFLTTQKTVDFINWNYSTIGPSGGGNMEARAPRNIKKDNPTEETENCSARVCMFVRPKCSTVEC